MAVAVAVLSQRGALRSAFPSIQPVGSAEFTPLRPFLKLCGGEARHDAGQLLTTRYVDSRVAHVCSYRVPTRLPDVLGIGCMY